MITPRPLSEVTFDAFTKGQTRTTGREILYGDTEGLRGPVEGQSVPSVPLLVGVVVYEV